MESKFLLICVILNSQVTKDEALGILSKKLPSCNSLRWTFMACLFVCRELRRALV